MADEDRAQSALIVEPGFERKNTEHQIEPARHLLDSAAVPGPNLRADVVNNFLRWRLFSQCAREAQVESRIIDQHHRVRLARLDFSQRRVKLLSKVTVMLDHFPQPEHARLLDPVLKIRTGDRSHLRTAATDEAKIDIGVTQG